MTFAPTSPPSSRTEGTSNNVQIKEALPGKRGNVLKLVARSRAAKPPAARAAATPFRKGARDLALQGSFTKGAVRSPHLRHDRVVPEARSAEGCP